jgi:hypothetical protein
MNHLKFKSISIYATCYEVYEDCNTAAPSISLALRLNSWPLLQKTLMLRVYEINTVVVPNIAQKYIEISLIFYLHCLYLILSFVKMVWLWSIGRNMSSS